MFRKVTQGLDVPTLPRVRGGTWAIAMVRDEADILAPTLRTLAAQGVDQILVVDNGSVDGTRDILRDLRHELPLHVGQDRVVAYEQAIKMTALTDIAASHGAEWIVPFDADELWLGRDGTLAETLGSQRRRIVRAEVFNIFPDCDRQGRWVIDPLAHYDSKVAFRPFPGQVLDMGNHDVRRPGQDGQGLVVLHRPWRSFDQFRRKVRAGSAALAAADVPSHQGRHWRALGALADGALADAWVSMLRGNSIEGNCWQPQGQTVPLPLEEPFTWAAVRAAVPGIGS